MDRYSVSGRHGIRNYRNDYSDCRNNTGWYYKNCGCNRNGQRSPKSRIGRKNSNGLKSLIGLMSWVVRKSRNGSRSCGNGWNNRRGWNYVNCFRLRLLA